LQKQLSTTEISNLTAEILILKQQTAQNIIEIVKRLIAVKESLPLSKCINIHKTIKERKI
jgi:hypothetical protein